MARPVSDVGTPVAGILSGRTDEVEALQVIRRLRVGELELAGAGGRFQGGAEVRPLRWRQGQVRAGKHGEAHVAEVGEAELQRAVAQVCHGGQGSRAGGIEDAYSGNLFGSFSGSDNLTNGNPLLAPLGNYGGPTPTMPPLPGSPAIDGCTNGTSFATDQRGFPRIVGPYADIGAVEGVFNPAGREP